MQPLNFDSQQQLDDTINADNVGAGAQGRRDDVVRRMTSGTPTFAVVDGLPLGELRYDQGTLSMHAIRYSQVVSFLPSLPAYHPERIAQAVERRLGVKQLASQYPQVLACLNKLADSFKAWQEFTQHNPDTSLNNPTAHAEALAYRNGLDQAYSHLLQAVLGQGSTD